MRRRRSVLVLSVMLLWVLPGVVSSIQSGGPGSPADSAAPAAGKVTGSQGKPVADAKVTIYRMAFSSSPYVPQVDTIAETTTGADGGFTFSADQSAAIYRGGCVVARKEGLAVGWAPPSRRGEQRFDITLEEPKDLSGMVVDEQSQPVAQADVIIAAAVSGKPEDQQNARAWMTPGFFHAKTDGSGRFVFAGMPAGATFEFLVRRPGYATMSTLRPTTMILPAASSPPKLQLQFSPGQAGIKLTLFREASVQGIVVEKTGGQPVSGAAVTAEPKFRGAPLRPERATSAPDGTFRIGGLDAGDYSVWATAPKGQMAAWSAVPVEVSLKTGEAKSDIKLQLAQGGTIEILVKDAAGKPVTRVSVSVRGIRSDRGFGGITDANGLARIRVTAGQYAFSGVIEEGRPRRTSEEQVTVADGETKRIEYTLTPRPKLAGIVRDEAGHPLAGVKIDIVPMMGPLRGEIMSDAAGKFEVAWDPDMGPQGIAFVLVARDAARNLAAAVDLDEQGGAFDVKLTPGVIITGTVQNEHGEPLPGARVQVTMRVSRVIGPLGRSDSATAGPDGKFEVKAIPPEREYTVSVVAEGFGRQSVRVDPGDTKDNRIDTGPFKLTRANLSVTGVVVDPNDKPVAGASVYGFGESQPDPHTIQTDAEGKFTLKGVCPGPIRVQVSSRGPKPVYGFAQAEGGATDLRIVVSARPTTRASMTPRRPTSLKGQSLPSLKDLGIDLPTDAEGKMVLVCFWDMGQRPSRNCLTQLAAQASQLGQKGVVVIPVHAAKAEEGALSQWLETNKLPFKVGSISGDIEKTKFAWGVASLPHLILTDKKHVVVAEDFGLGDLDKQIEAAADR